jgi:hypothetical protein
MLLANAVKTNCVCDNLLRLLLLLLQCLREEKLLEPFRQATGGSVRRSTKESLLYDSAVTAAYSFVISSHSLFHVSSLEDWFTGYVYELLRHVPASAPNKTCESILRELRAGQHFIGVIALGGPRNDAANDICRCPS